MSVEEVKKKVYSAVHFYDDQSKTIVFVESTNIKYFDVNDPDIYKKPYYIQRIDDASGEKEYYPAQIHKIADTIEELQTNKKRYRYHNIRASDAAYDLKCMHSNELEAADKLTDDKDSKENCKIAGTKSSRIDSINKIEDDKEIEIERKLKALQQVNLTFEKGITREDKLKNEIMIIRTEKNKIIGDLEKKLAAYEEIIAEQKKVIKDLRLEVLEFKDEVSFLKSVNEKISKPSNSFKCDDSLSLKQPQSIGNILSPQKNRTQNCIPMDDHSPLARQFSISDQCNSNDLELVKNSSLPKGKVSLSPKALTPTAESSQWALDENSQCSTPRRHQNLFNIKEKINSICEVHRPDSPLATGSKKDKILKSPFLTHSRKRKRENVDAEIDKKVKRSKEKKKKKDKEEKVTKDEQKKSSKTENSKSKKKSHKKKKCNSRKSDSEYDSDNFIKNERKVMEIWKKNTEDGIVTMIHLMYGVSIPTSSWKIVKQQKKPTLFLKKLSRAIWGSYHLANRAICVEKCTSHIPHRSPKKALTPVKKAVLRKLYFCHINETMAKAEDRNNYKNSWKLDLGAYINYLMRTYKEDAKSDESNSDSESNTKSDNSDNSKSVNESLTED